MAQVAGMTATAEIVVTIIAPSMEQTSGAISIDKWLLVMQWTAPTRRHLGAKFVVFVNHRETGAVHERSYHDRC